MVRRRAIAGAACVHLAAMRAVSNHGSRFGLAAILRDALASLGLLRMRSEFERFTASEAGNDTAVSPLDRFHSSKTRSVVKLGSDLPLNSAGVIVLDPQLRAVLF